MIQTLGPFDVSIFLFIYENYYVLLRLPSVTTHVCQQQHLMINKHSSFSSSLGIPKVSQKRQFGGWGRQKGSSGSSSSSVHVAVRLSWGGLLFGWRWYRAGRLLYCRSASFWIVLIMMLTLMFRVTRSQNVMAISKDSGSVHSVIMFLFLLMEEKVCSIAMGRIDGIGMVLMLL